MKSWQSAIIVALLIGLASVLAIPTCAPEQRSAFAVSKISNDGDPSPRRTALEKLHAIFIMPHLFFPKSPVSKPSSRIIPRQLPAPKQICETTEGSPKQMDVARMAWQLQDAKGDCCQINDGPCTDLKREITGAISICGPKGNCVPCRELGKRAMKLAGDCRDWKKSGGIVRWGTHLDMNIYRNPDYKMPTLWPYQM
ncbi:hypothetical protein BZA05DRAFT_445640 [Tricharina praecox]|uniref:uncharacterized protein n=1 Tax=Tricharina praecox TaxID=43433 RepID=UPI00222006E6|nr:uncharacterized protein BZA05DRAFT_445640 [Tricharina praecox]KAI5850800.1 hypothetical protein BZA05DRAFT_445640 [Tricharina praecox]